MKNSNIIFGLAFIAAAFVVGGCSREINQIAINSERVIKGVNVGKISNGTKCSTGSDDILFTEPIVTDQGDTLYLTVSIGDMPESVELQKDDVSKAAPVTTSNIAELYESFITTAYDETGNIYKSVIDPEAETKEYRSMDSLKVTYRKSESQWMFDDGVFYWPEDEKEHITFCSYAPVGVFDETAKPQWNGSIYSFSYKMPKDAAGKVDAELQKDLLVAVDEQTKTVDGQVNVKFKHALTAVRFVKGDIGNVTLEYISLNNICDRGDCKLEGDKLTWENVSGKETFRQLYNTPIASTDPQHMPFDKTDNGDLTFMVIPQLLTEESEISIYIKGNLHPETLRLKKYVEEKGIKDIDKNYIYDWRPYAGKQITFAISATKINNVSVSVDDVLTQDPSTHYPRKEQVVITNTGRSDIYIRATLVGSWQNAAGQNLVHWSINEPYGFFEGGLLGNGTDEYWVEGADGFYYYRKYIPKPDIATGTYHVVQHPLFDAFQLTSAPVRETVAGTEEAGQDLNIAQLSLKILVQAIVADQDGSKKAAKAAWGENVDAYLSTYPDE